MYPILFQIGSIPIYTYGFILFIDLLISLYFIHRYSKKLELDFDKIFNIFFITIISSYIGGKIGFIIFNLPIKSLILNPIELLITIVSPSEGGLTIIGAIIAAIIAIFLSSKHYGLDFITVMDLFSLVALVSISIGRIGCLMAGCCYGKACYHCLVTIDLQGVPRYPTQLMESIFSFIGFLYLRKIYHKNYKRGIIFTKFLIIYGIIRFIVEIFRESQTAISIANIINISWAQIFSLFFIISGIIIHKIIVKNTHKEEEL